MLSLTASRPCGVVNSSISRLPLRTLGQAPSLCHNARQRLVSQPLSPSRKCTVQAARPQGGSTGLLGSPEQFKAHGLTLGVQAVFAVWYIVGHIVLTDNDPLTFALARELLSAAALLVMAQMWEGPLKIKSFADGVDIVVLGLMCYGTVMGFMFSLSDLPEVQVAVAQPLVPALALGMSALAGMEKLSFVSALGIVFSITGAVTFTALNTASASAASEGVVVASGNHTFGYIALAFELLTYAAHLTYLPRVSRKYGSISLTAMYYTVASLASAGTLVFREREHLHTLWSQIEYVGQPSVAAALLFAVLGPTVFCYISLSYSSKKLAPSITSAYITLQPLFVAALSLVLFQKYLSGQECSAGLLVMLGLYLSVTGNPRVDREWALYFSDLPTNVPQTIASVADAGVSAVGTAADSVLDAGGDMRDWVVESREAVGDYFRELRDGAAEEGAGAGREPLEVPSRSRSRSDDA